MGSEQSSLANSDTNPAFKVGKDLSAGGRGGRKSHSTEATACMSTTSLLSGDFEPSHTFEVTHLNVIDDEPATTDESSILDDSEDESDDEDVDEYEFQEALAERRRVLEDANNLKKVANYYLHPEKPVEVDPAATARCYFDRSSAPERLSAEEAEERAMILEELKVMKQKAVDYMHPEMPVVTSDPAATARCFFDRPSAPERLSPEEADERAMVLEEAMQLKKLAVDYMHPEVPVTATDPYACGRNYFSRYSADHADPEEEEERARVLEEAKQLKKLAVDYMHPEVPVTTTDPCAYGRNYFTRPSALEQEDLEEAEERARVLAECAALKQKAVDYMHPEIGVTTTDPFACGRNYFTRPSAPEEEDPEEAEERARVLAECAALKQKALDYKHPELPCVTTDPFACGRNYFSRPSAPEQEDPEVAEERARVLADAKLLKQKAVDYMHPELPCVTTDPFACGRNYFSRYSAPEQEDHDIDEEHERILEDIKQLKQLAKDYLHPEIPVVTSDPFACGRNYFTRASALEQECLEEVEERERCLAEAKQLKQLATDYRHPEIPVVTTDPFACGRNYFSRYSAMEQMAPEEAEERARILEEMALMKQLVVNYRHPELPVVTTDSTALGRNYFSRYPAAGHAGMIHTFPAHADDDHHDDHDHHVEPWGFDEDLAMGDITHQVVVPTLGKVAAGGEEEEGNLSRSPSTVLLYPGESVYD